MPCYATAVSAARFVTCASVRQLLVPFVGCLVSRRRAASEPTQTLMDERVRSRNPRYLPWRVVHLVKAPAPPCMDHIRLEKQSMHGTHGITRANVKLTCPMFLARVHK